MPPIINPFTFALIFTIIGFLLGIMATLLWVSLKNRGNTEKKAINAVIVKPEVPPQGFDRQTPLQNLPQAQINHPIQTPPQLIPTPKISAKAPPISNPQANGEGTMVQQIDEIIQQIVLRSPNPNRIIHLKENPNTGVVVWVGTQQFAGIDTVSDPEARAIIRTAVSEWERRVARSNT